MIKFFYGEEVAAVVFVTAGDTESLPFRGVGLLLMYENGACFIFNEMKRLVRSLALYLFRWCLILFGLILYRILNFTKSIQNNQKPNLV